MVKILAIDTSTSACSVALLVDDQIHENFILIPQSHTQHLLPMVDQLLAVHQQSLQQLDAIALTTGPGSFTGLRIGLGIVQGLAFGADLPVVGISSLQAMSCGASRLLNIDQGAHLIPSLDARMREVYWGHYQIETDKIQCIDKDSVGDPGLMFELVSEPSLAVVGIGDGWACVNESALTKWISTRGETTIVSDFYPHAYDVAQLAELSFRQGQMQSALDISPVYIRTEVSWKKRRRIRPTDGK